MAKSGHVSEADFQRAVLDLAKLYGWKTAHFRPAQARDGRWLTPVQGDGAGFPDLVLVRDDRLIFAELKGATGRIKTEQRDWLLRLRTAGATAVVWRPSDLDQVAETLRR